MKLSYATFRLRRLCEEQKFAKKELGNDCAKQLAARIEDLYAFSKVGEIVAGRPHPLIGDRKGQFALRLSKGFRLIIVPSQEVVEDSDFDWKEVSEVIVVEIGDYHD